MYFDGAQGVGTVKSTDFGEGIQKKKFDTEEQFNYTRDVSIFPQNNTSAPTLAFNFGNGGHDDGAFNA